MHEFDRHKLTDRHTNRYSTLFVTSIPINKIAFSNVAYKTGSCNEKVLVFKYELNLDPNSNVFE